MLKQLFPHIAAFLRWLKTWFRLPRTLRVTATGWKFLGLTLIVGFAAMNTANNLLYLVFGLMLSFITASGILSEFMLRRVSLVRRFPRHIFAQSPASVIVALTNRKRFIASFSLLIQDFTQTSTSKPSLYILKIPANQTVSVSYLMTFSRRGLHRPGKIRLSTCYPFGLFQKSATFVETEDTILVYPEIQRLHPADIPNPSSHTGEFESRRKGHGLEIHGVREYVQGDSSNRISWKSTAKLARLMTKEFHDDQRKKVSLILDISLSGKAAPAELLQDVDRAVSLTASYAVYFTRNNFQTQLITPETQSPFDVGQRHLFVILRTLALFQPKNGQSRQQLTHALQRMNHSDVVNIFISLNNLASYKTLHFS